MAVLYEVYYLFYLNLKLQFRGREIGGISPMAGSVVSTAGFCTISAVNSFPIWQVFSKR